ncbi:hypothetical protein GCM10027051_13360 [Niabella terrae]
MFPFSVSYEHKNILYQYCIAEWLPVIEQHRREINIRKGAALFEEGSPVGGIYFIIKGKIKIHQRWTTEKELILRFARDGDMVGHRGLARDKQYPITATALEDSQLFYLPIDIFEATLKVNPQLTYALMDFYANELEATERRVRHMAHMNVKSRIAEALLGLRQLFGLTEEGFIDIRLTKQELAAYVGTTYETISRMLANLEQEGLIRSDGKNLMLLKENNMMQLIEKQSS